MPQAAPDRPSPNPALTLTLTVSSAPQYIESERDKFGREVDAATAGREVDEWLLKQARLIRLGLELGFGLGLGLGSGSAMVRFRRVAAQAGILTIWLYLLWLLKQARLIRVRARVRTYPTLPKP